MHQHPTPVSGDRLRRTAERCAYLQRRSAEVAASAERALAEARLALVQSGEIAARLDRERARKPTRAS